MTDVLAIEIQGARLNPFPNSGMTGRFLTANEEFQAVEFTTPASATDWASRAPSKTFEWDESQVGGAAVLNRTLITIRSCPGDFRLAPAGTAPATEPTFARGCTNFRTLAGFPGIGPRSNIPYVIDSAPSDDTTCRLAPGRRYFINLIRADVSDGAIGPPSMEAACANPELSTCGVQLRYF